MLDAGNVIDSNSVIHYDARKIIHRVEELIIAPQPIPTLIK